MMKQSLTSKLCNKYRDFRRASGGNVMVMFALSLVPIMGGVGMAVDYSQSASLRTALQAAADSASLGTLKVAGTLPADGVQTTAAGFFNASFKRPQANPSVVALYDQASNAVTVTASAVFKPSFMGLMGISDYPVSATSVASMRSKTWQVCVMVTSPNENHTLLVKGGSKIDFDNCMVQVNTLNWDAVEARDTSYIHSKNGENCYVGEIHYGDVQPPKNTSCTFFPDPFDSLSAPDNACTYNNKVVNTPGEVLNPGTYCGGILVNQSAVFKPGLYILRDGKFQIVGAMTNVTALGATFVLVGSNGYLDFNTSGTITMSPATEADAGQFAGFVFYYDDPDVVVNGKKKSNKKGAKSTISSATFNATGIIYLVGQKFVVDSNASVTINPGSIIADFILPDSGGKLKLTGTLNSGLAVLNSMKKTGSGSGGLSLVK